MQALAARRQKEVVTGDPMATMKAANELLKAKEMDLKARRLHVTNIVCKSEKNIDKAEFGEPVPRGCGLCSLLFGPKRAAATVGSKTATATDKLTLAGKAVHARVTDLNSRLTTMRSEARALATNGKKQDALAVLRRTKAVEKQLGVAQTTADALDMQIMVLEEANLQKEVSAALGASVKAVRKKTKTLLKDTESAVDGASEVRDLAEDLGVAFEGLRSTDTVDDDELLDELNKLVERGKLEADATEIVRAPALEEPARQLSEITENAVAYPETPVAPPTQTKRAQRREERSKLLPVAA